MKFFVIALSLMSAVAVANEENFAAAKADAIAHIDRRIEGLNAAKTCISAATDKAGLKKCREEMKVKAGEIREMRKAGKARRQENRKKKD